MTSSPSVVPAIRLRVRSLRAMAIVAVLTLMAAAPSAGKEPFDSGRLWRISKAGVADSFVLGTIHIADPRVALIAKPVEKALARSRSLAVEMVPEARDARTFDLEELEDGKRLEPLIGVETFARLREELTAQNVPAPVIERLKPWAAMMKISRSVRKAGQDNLDEQLLVAARLRHLHVLSLELVEEQIAAFDSIPLDTQVALLRHVLENRDALAGNVEPTIAAWLSGDLAGLARISDWTYERFPAIRTHYSRLIQHLIYDRTVLMHHRLFLPLRAGRVFVAIGALHLYGDKGLLAMLREDGYAVNRLW